MQLLALPLHERQILFLFIQNKQSFKGQLELESMLDAKVKNNNKINDLEAIATKTLARESPLQQKLLVSKVKKSVMEACDEQKIQDAEMLDGIDIKTWEVALTQLKLVLEKTEDDKCPSVPECATEKRTSHIVELNVCCKCCCVKETIKLKAHFNVENLEGCSKLGSK